MKLTSITIGQYFPGDSLIHRLDPRTKILLSVAYGLLIFLPRQWEGFAAMGALTFAALLLSQVPPAFIFRGMRTILIFFGITAAINLFMTPGETVVWHWGVLTVTQEGLALTAQSLTRLFLLIITASLLTLTTSPIVLTDGMERLLRPFQRIGVPAHELALMMTIALRFIPTLAAELERIMRAQAARGAEFTRGGLLSRVRALIPVMVPLFVSAFRRADELATAMEARGYRGGVGRTRMKELQYAGRDLIAGAVFLAVAAFVLWVKYGRG